MSIYRWTMDYEVSKSKYLSPIYISVFVKSWQIEKHGWSYVHDGFAGGSEPDFGWRRSLLLLNLSWPDQAYWNMLVAGGDTQAAGPPSSSSVLKHKMSNPHHLSRPAYNIDINI